MWLWSDESLHRICLDQEQNSHPISEITQSALYIYFLLLFLGYLQSHGIGAFLNNMASSEIRTHPARIG